MMKGKEIKSKNKVSSIFYKIASDTRVIVDVLFFYFDIKNNERIKSIKLIVDTGATTTVLNRKFAEKIGFIINKHTPKTEIETAGTQNEIVYTHIVSKMKLKNNLNQTLVEVENLEILTYDIPVRETEFGGILGLDFFKDKKICLDLRNKILDIT